MRKAALIAVTIFTALNFIAPYADAYTASYTQTVTTGQGDPAIKMRVWIKDEKMRVETNAGGHKGMMIYREKDVYTFIPQRDMWMKMPQSQDQEFQYVEDTQDFMEYLKKNGAVKTGTETVGGYPCDIYKYTDKKTGADYTTWVWQEKDFPVKMVVKARGITSTILFSKIRINEPLSEDLFEVPRGQKTVDMSNIGGMIKSFQD